MTEGKMFRPLKLAGLSAAILAASPVGLALAQMPQNSVAAANIRQSEHYDAVLRHNSAFRAKRVAEECGPINDPQLHAQCVASFDSGAEAPAHGR